MSLDVFLCFPKLRPGFYQTLPLEPSRLRRKGLATSIRCRSAPPEGSQW